MGEIAEALKRATESGGGASVAATPGRRLPRSVAPASSSHRPEPAALSGPPSLEELRPLDPAVIVDDGPQLEKCRHLALRVRKELDLRGVRTMAVTSGMRDEGKTTVICNLSIALASLSRGRRVALVDLDLRKPSIAEVLGIKDGCGIEQVLFGKSSLDEARVSVGRPQIDIYPAYEPQRAAHEIFVLPRFTETIQELSNIYDVVLVDTPPTLLVPDTTLILSQVSACLPIARVGRTRARAFRQMLDLLPRKQILGELMNGARAPRFSNDHYYYQAPSVVAGEKQE
jgi:Mrp family chromosome partitioning ATPase